MTQTDKISALVEFIFKCIYFCGRGLCIRYFANYDIDNKPSKSYDPNEMHSVYEFAGWFFWSWIDLSHIGGFVGYD